MLGRIKNSYHPDTDGRIYRLSLQEKNNIFINLDERELVEMAEILLVRRKKLAIKLIAVVDEVGEFFQDKNLLLEEIKSRCL